MDLLLVVLFGLVIGSFVGALSYRLPRNISIAKGRSFCPNCRSTISWHDNIPVISFFALGGKCRHCRSKISPRYFLIESTTAAVFGLVYLSYPGLILNNLTWLKSFSVLGLLLILFLSCVFILIFIIDVEHQIIPDTLIFSGLLITVLALSLFGSSPLFHNLFYGVVTSLFLLSVFLVTRGRGMGLGDVKLAVLLGLVLGEKSVVALFIAFLTGAVVGIILMLTGNAGPKTKIAFGPFLVFGFFVALLLGRFFVSQFFWYL